MVWVVELGRNTYVLHTYIHIHIIYIYIYIHECIHTHTTYILPAKTAHLIHHHHVESLGFQGLGFRVQL
jgi:hypothetical protein